MAGRSAGHGKGAGGGVKAPSPPGQQPMKAAPTAAPTMGDPMTMGASHQAKPTLSSAAKTGSGVPHQTKKMPFGPPALMAGGLVFLVSIAYFTLNPKQNMDKTVVIKEAGK